MREGPTGSLDYRSAEQRSNGNIQRYVDITVYGPTEQDVREILADAPNVVGAIERAREKARLTASSYAPPLRATLRGIERPLLGRW